MAFLAGVEYELPAVGEPARGPTAGDVAAAGEMSEADRKEMIRGMVTQLSDRLATEGGPPAEWARLIRALGVFGRYGSGKSNLRQRRHGVCGQRRGFNRGMQEARASGWHFAMIYDKFEEFVAALAPLSALVGLDLGEEKPLVFRSLTVLAPWPARLRPLGGAKFTLDAERLLAIMADRQIGGIVLGLPRNMNGSEGPRCQSTRAFARNLARFNLARFNLAGLSEVPDRVLG